MIPITAALTLSEREVEERFVRASGPGGQNVNKVSTAVELRFDVGASSLPEAIKARLITIGGHRVTAAGILIIDSREHRTQAQNREAARARLVSLIRAAAKRPRTRRPTRPGAAAREQRLAAKTIRAKVKASRRPEREGDD